LAFQVFCEVVAVVGQVSALTPAYPGREKQISINCLPRRFLLRGVEKVEVDSYLIAAYQDFLR
jgi:hypothetical protein